MSHNNKSNAASRLYQTPGNHGNVYRFFDCDVRKKRGNRNVNENVYSTIFDIFIKENFAIYSSEIREITGNKRQKNEHNSITRIKKSLIQDT